MVHELFHVFGAVARCLRAELTSSRVRKSRGPLSDVDGNDRDVSSGVDRQPRGGETFVDVGPRRLLRPRAPGLQRRQPEPVPGAGARGCGRLAHGRSAASRRGLAAPLRTGTLRAGGGVTPLGVSLSRATTRFGGKQPAGPTLRPARRLEVGVPTRRAWTAFSAHGALLLSERAKPASRWQRNSGSLPAVLGEQCERGLPPFGKKGTTARRNSPKRVARGSFDLRGSSRSFLPGFAAPLSDCEPHPEALDGLSARPGPPPRSRR